MSGCRLNLKIKNKIQKISFKNFGRGFKEAVRHGDGEIFDKFSFFLRQSQIEILIDTNVSIGQIKQSLLPQPTELSAQNKSIVYRKNLFCNQKQAEVLIRSAWTSLKITDIFKAYIVTVNPTIPQIQNHPSKNILGQNSRHILRWFLENFSIIFIQDYLIPVFKEEMDAHLRLFEVFLRQTIFENSPWIWSSRNFKCNN